MKARDIISSFRWGLVTDWSDLSSSEHFLKYSFVTERDVEVFVIGLFHHIARIVGIPYDQLEPILREENEAFFMLKSQLFETGCSYSKDASRLSDLKNLLRIPDLQQPNLIFNEITISDKVEKLSAEVNNLLEKLKEKLDPEVQR